MPEIQCNATDPNTWNVIVIKKAYTKSADIAHEKTSQEQQSQHENRLTAVENQLDFYRTNYAETEEERRKQRNNNEITID